MTWGAGPQEQASGDFWRSAEGPLRKPNQAIRSVLRTHLFFADSADAEWIDVTIASLDDPSPFSPKVSIWTEDRLAWVPMDKERLEYERSRTGADNAVGG